MPAPVFWCIFVAPQLRLGGAYLAAFNCGEAAKEMRKGGGGAAGVRVQNEGQKTRD
jgi:hypothetical protein